MDIASTQAGAAATLVFGQEFAKASKTWVTDNTKTLTAAEQEKVKASAVESLSDADKTAFAEYEAAKTAGTATTAAQKTAFANFTTAQNNSLKSWGDSALGIGSDGAFGLAATSALFFAAAALY